MSHFSTILLIEQVKGLSARIEFCKRIEESYGDSRQVDSEKPMVKIDGSKPGDTTVTYDKMGWVVWMLLHEMGRENLMRGLHGFPERVRRQPRPSGASGLHGVSAAVRARPRGVRRVRQAVVPRGRRPRVHAGRREEARERGRVRRSPSRSRTRGRRRCPSRSRPPRASVSTTRASPRRITRMRARRSRLAAGETKDVTVRCDFDPDRVRRRPRRRRPPAPQENRRHEALVDAPFSDQRDPRSFVRKRECPLSSRVLGPCAARRQASRSRPCRL